MSYTKNDLLHVRQQLISELAGARDGAGYPLFKDLDVSDARTLVDQYFAAMSAYGGIESVQQIAALGIFLSHWEGDSDPVCGWTEDLFSEDEMVRAILAASSMNEKPTALMCEVKA